MSPAPIAPRPSPPTGPPQASSLETANPSSSLPAGPGPNTPSSPDHRTPGGPPLLPSARPGSALRSIATWLRGSRLGLVVMALMVGVGAGLGAVGFRWLIFAFTWLATGHQQFGQQGRVGSLHLPWLGTGFLFLVPVLGGLIYGPLIQRFAKEARGHGVPEVMLAVAENGGRIRPPVTIVKALASALCIGTGGSVGREGPIVQIGSAFASTLGQVVRMSETRLRVIVACGAAGGIAATFNAPMTGLFFGFEIVLREFSLDALFATSLSAVAADLVSQAFFGSAPFFSGIPHDLLVPRDATYVLVAVLGVLSGLVGYGFKAALYKLEDVADRLWKGRPEWARPAVGGIALGALLLALPQMYGVGYPVMDKAVAGHFVLWFLVLLMIGKVAATSVTLSIGGSGGVFAPSLFTGAMAGMAFGSIAHHLFGNTFGSTAIFAVVGMGATFGAAAQAPLTALASVVEMTGNFTLILPVMLATGIAAAVSKRFSYGSIYTTKLLRRGIDIEGPKAASVLQMLTVADVMRPLVGEDGRPVPLGVGGEGQRSEGEPTLPWDAVAGTVNDIRQPQVLFPDEVLAQALRQIALFGRNGLPVVARDGEHLLGWVTRQDVLAALAERVGATRREAKRGRSATEGRRVHGGGRPSPSSPLDGYEIVEVVFRPGAPGIGHRLSELSWPPGSIVVGVTEGRDVVAPRDDIEIRVSERVVLIAPASPPTAKTAEAVPTAAR
jgi:CIC family chloride channel protein